MKKLLDIHTHRVLHKTDNLSIYNFDFLKDKNLADKQLFSMGLHPWWVGTLKVDEVLALIQKNLNNPYFAAMGEMGLDFSLKTSRCEQKRIFKIQLEFAKKHKIKNIIIHCVKAYNEVQSLILGVGYKGNIIFHDYNGNASITKSLLKYPCYFSFGKSLFTYHGKFKNQVHLLRERLFLETDDQDMYSLDEIYCKAALLSNLKKEDLLKLVYNNFNNCFGDLIRLS